MTVRELIKKLKKNPRSANVGLILLLDVDGVICPIGSSLKAEKVIRVKSGWNSGYIKNGVVHWLKEISDKYQVIWFTSWLEDANKINELINIKKFRVIDVLNNQNNTRIWNKWGVLEALCNKNIDYQFIVIDDEAPEESDLEKCGVVKPSNLTLFKINNQMSGLCESDMKLLEKKLFDIRFRLGKQR